MAFLGLSLSFKLKIKSLVPSRLISSYMRKSMRPGESIIGRRPIKLVENVKLLVDKVTFWLKTSLKTKHTGFNLVQVDGPLGTISQLIRSQVDLEFTATDRIRLVQDHAAVDYDKALLGTYRTIIQNMIHDAAIGYFEELELHGIGFRAFFKKEDGINVLRMRLGTTHDVKYVVPSDILVTVNKEGNGVTVFGCDRRRVGNEAAKIRRLKKPEPYKGKGIRYKGEVIKLKSVKKQVRK